MTGAWEGGGGLGERLARVVGGAVVGAALLASVMGVLVWGPGRGMATELASQLASSVVQEPREFVGAEEAQGVGDSRSLDAEGRWGDAEDGGCAVVAGSQVTCEADAGRGRALRSLVFVPQGYGEGGDEEGGADGGAWPLLVFLHGAVGAGEDVGRAAAQGPPKLVEAGRPMGWDGAVTPHAFLAAHFVVVSPQLGQLGQEWDPETVSAMVEGFTRGLRVDRDRVYLTGASMGGSGAWNAAAGDPQRYAAVAPVCGWAEDVAAVAEALKGIPVRVYHGENDEVVPVSRSDDLVAALKEAGNAEVVYERFEAADRDPNWATLAWAKERTVAGHAAWVRAYDEGDSLYTWLLEHSRKPDAS